MNSISITSRICILCVLVLIGVSLNGCYLLESAQGQLAAHVQAPARSRGSSPIRRTPADVRKQLEAVAQIREFASRNLHLPDNGSYRSLCRCRPALRGLERRRGSGVLGRAEGMVLSHRRLRRVSRLLRRAARSSLRRCLAEQGVRCERRRGGRLFDPGPLRRSHPEYHDRLERRRAGVDHFPRAHASDDLHARTMPISTRRSRPRSRRRACAAGSRALAGQQSSSATSSRNSGSSRS